MSTACASGQPRTILCKGPQLDESNGDLQYGDSALGDGYPMESGINDQVMGGTKRREYLVQSHLLFKIARINDFCCAKSLFRMGDE